MFSHELKTSALITKIEPAAKAEIIIDIYSFNSLVKLYEFSHGFIDSIII